MFLLVMVARLPVAEIDFVNCAWQLFIFVVNGGSGCRAGAPLVSVVLWRDSQQL
jgi:hypothetical protein